MQRRSVRYQKDTVIPGQVAIAAPLPFVAMSGVPGAVGWFGKAAVARGERRGARRCWPSLACKGAGEIAEIVRMAWVSAKRLLMLMLFYSAFADAGAAERHPAGVSCGNCHLSANPDRSNAGQLLADEGALCANCHRNAVHASHPIGVEPDFAPPAALPLNARGEITCSTCHQVHGETQQKLRPGRDGQSLCESCHERSFFDAMKDGGISLMALGHLDAGEPLSGNIDNFSIQCLACHEDSADVGHQQASGSVSSLVKAKANHPIGRRYTDSIGFGGYRPAHRLPSTILLPDGKLSCLSCHVGYSDAHGDLVVENRADRLCSACHAL